MRIYMVAFSEKGRALAEKSRIFRYLWITGMYFVKGKRCRKRQLYICGKRSLWMCG